MQKVLERSKRFPTIIVAGDFAMIALIEPQKHLFSDSPLVPATPPKACTIINQNVLLKKNKKHLCLLKKTRSRIELLFLVG